MPERSRPVNPDHLPPLAEERQDLHPRRAVSATVRLGGSVCQFEQVRGGGEAEIIRLARLQHGHIHRSQIEAAGMTRGAIEHRLSSGWLQATLPSVYRLGISDDTRLGRAMSVALHFKGNALVSHSDAAELWQILDSTQRLTEHQPIDVLLLGRSYHPVAGVRVHRSMSLARQDIRWRNGIPVTSPARMMLDLAAELDDLELEAAAIIARRRHGLRSSQLMDVAARNPKAKGVARLSGLLDNPGQLSDTRSKYERKLRRLLRDADLPSPVTNGWVAGRMVDMVWPELKLVVEFDGWEVHGRRESFETDRIRDQDLAMAAHRVVRITARQIDLKPYALVARLATIMTAIRISQ